MGEEWRKDIQLLYATRSSFKYVRTYVRTRIHTYKCIYRLEEVLFIARSVKRNVHKKETVWRDTNRGEGGCVIVNI